MECFVSNLETDPLLLLKERIIKTDTLLDKYASLTRKLNDLEKSHSQAIENEKKAKKDAIKFLEKYCKLAKKSNCLLNKIKTLEDEINTKSNELRESQDECAKLESVLQVYRTERKGHQCLKKDRDFLLTNLWKVLKRLQEEPRRGCKSKKITETFFKKFERELMDLKLEDFRYNKVNKISRLREKEESEIVFSPESLGVGSAESDFIDTDIGSESVKSSFEKSDDNYVVEKTTNTDSNHSLLDTEHQSDIENVQVNILENQDLSLSDLSLGTCQDLGKSVDSVPLGEDILKDSLEINTLENNDFNLCKIREEEGTFESLTLTNFTTEGAFIFDTEIKSDAQDQSDCCQNDLNLNGKCFPVESEDKPEKEEELRQTPERARKTYLRRKFQSSGQNHEIVENKISENCHLTDMGFTANGGGVISDLVDVFACGNTDVLNVSSENINLDTDVTLGDIGSIPHHFDYCDIIYDFLKSSNEKRHTTEENFYEQDSYLLFSAADELVGNPGEENSDTEKTHIQESYGTASVFDVDDRGSFTPSGCVRDEGVGGNCVDFSSDNGNETGLTEDVNMECQGKEKNNFTGPDEIPRNTGNRNQVDKENSQNIYDSRLKEMNTDGNSINTSNSELNRQGNNIPDEVIYRILKEYERVPLLSPLQEEVPKKRRKLSPQQSQEHNNCNRSQNTEVTDNVQNMEPSEEVSRDEPNGEELAPNAETDKEKEGKMVDAFMQTDDEVSPGEHEVEQQNDGVNKAVVISQSSMRKLCKFVWKKNLRMFRNLTSYRRMRSVHLSCLDLVKELVGIANQPRLCTRNRRENYVFINRRLNQRNSSQSSKRQLTPWLVEDVDGTSAASKNEPPFNYPKVEDCNSPAEAPMDCYSTDGLNDSTVKSEEMQSQRNMSCDLSASDQQIELCGNAGGYNIDLEREYDSDNALPNFNSNDTVNNCETMNEDSAEAHEMTENVENTLESNLENRPEIDGISSDGLENKANNLEKCDELEEIESGEACSKTEESVMVRKRISRIRSQDSLVIEANNRTNGNGIIREESNNLMKVGISEGSLPSANSTFMERHERYSIESINDSLPTKEVPEKPKCSTLKDKFAEFFGETESPSECSSESSGNVTPKKKVQKQVSGNLQSSTNGDMSDIRAVRKKRRGFSGNIKADRTYSKKMKWELLSVCGESSEEGSPENGAALNDTFSSQDLETGDNSNILDSIMTAMTKQSEYFKVQTQTPLKETEVSGGNCRNICSPAQPPQPKNSIISTSVHRKISNEYRMKGENSALLNLPYYWTVDNNFGKQAVKGKEGSSNHDVNRSEEAKVKSAVKREIRKFLNGDINSVDEGEEKIKSCIAVLRKASEIIIANAIVNEIMANVDEEVKEFERPAPPLTQTQHRIMIILRVLSLSDEQFHRISNQILKIIRSKIFPDNFFWPDDSLEMASRFYAALCKRLNDFKGIWKFCFKVITSMRQRWCIPVLVVLQVWPDIIHNASYVQNNLLVTAFVNVILHAPRSVGMRRKRQEQKLLAIKHLLINFYNFDVNSTIEGFTEKLWESFVNNTSGSVDAIVLICKCRPWSWTRTNVIAKLLGSLESWIKGEGSDVMVSEVLDILHQITVIFPDANSTEASSFKNVISVLSQVLWTERLNSVSREKMIRILCDVCHYTVARDVLLKFSEKLSTCDPLYASIKKALSSKKGKGKRSFKKANTKTTRMQRKNMKPKKNKRNSSRQKSVLESVKA